MGSPEAVIRATVNRIGARLGHGLADAAAELAVLAQNVPERIRQEWELFQEEVRAEAERLEQKPASTTSASVQSPGGEPTVASESPQDTIDRLRARVAELSQRLEARS